MSLYDYLLRNFQLYRLESAYEVREDLIDAIKRMCPRSTHASFIQNTGNKNSGSSGSGKVMFNGWARMALPLINVAIDEVIMYRC